MTTVLSKCRKAINLYGMITSGDRIAVGVSGGKDSMLLLYALHLLSGFEGQSFSVCGITADMQFGGKEGDFDAVRDFCTENGIEYHIVKTDIWDIVFNRRHEANPCSLCSRMRKGALYDAASEIGCNKVALGHHADDAAATFYMNLLGNGTLGCFSPVTELPDKGITVIRPFVLTDERDIIHAVKAERVPVVKSRCTVNGQTERARTEELIRFLNKDYKHIKEKTVGALMRSHICGW